MSLENLNYTFMQQRDNLMIYNDLFSNVMISKERLTSDVTEAMNALKEHGRVTLSDGLEVDMGDSSGPMILNMHMDQLNAKSTFVDSMFETIKSYEKSLQTTLGQ